MGVFDRTLGGLVIGAFFNAHIFGLVSYQYASYHNTKFRDPRWIKAMVLSLCCLDTFHSAELIYMVWLYCVTNYAQPDTAADTLWPYTIAPIVNSLSGVIVHSFLGYCAYRATAKVFSLVFVLVLAVASFSVGFGYGIRVLLAASIRGIYPLHKFHIAYLSVEFGTNAVISSILAYVVYTAPNGFRTGEHISKRLLHAAIQIGFISTIFSFAGLLALVTASNSSIYAIFYLPLGRIYSNSTLSTLLSRDVKSDDPLSSDGPVQFSTYSSLIQTEHDTRPARRRSHIQMPTFRIDEPPESDEGGNNDLGDDLHKRM